MNIQRFLNKESFFSRFRYVSVLILFLGVTFYSLNITPNDEGSSRKNSNEDEEQAARSADLDGDIREISYVKKIDSQAGDYYRVLIRAEANEDVLVGIYIRSLLGIEKKVGEITIKEGVSAPYEQVFATDGIYHDITLRRSGKTISDDTSWDGVKIYISDVFTTRLNVASQFMAAQLKPTIFGNTQTTLRQLPSQLPGKVDQSLMSGGRNIGEYFEPVDSAISSVYAKLSVVGNGGVGQYSVEVLEYDADGFSVAKTVAEISFEADKLWKYADEEHRGLYRFEMPVVLNREKLYFIRFGSKDVTTDEKNGLELVRFGENEEGEGGGFIALGTVQYTQVGSGKSAARILSGATIQDIGSAYLYEYRMSHTEKDLLDLQAAKGKPKYDKELGMITQSEADGAAFEYKIDTVYPFEKMNVLVDGVKGEKRSGFQVEYSYDGKDWQKVLSEDSSEPDQKANFIIDGRGRVATVYVKVIHYGKSQKNDVLGISDFRVSALLKK